MCNSELKQRLESAMRMRDSMEQQAAKCREYAQDPGISIKDRLWNIDMAAEYEWAARRACRDIEHLQRLIQQDGVE